MRRRPGTGPVPHLSIALFALILSLGACAPAATRSWTFGPTLGSEPSAAPSTDPSPSPSAAPTASAAPSPAAGGVADTSFTVVRTEPCPESRFECVTLAVARDHFAPPGGPTWDVTYAFQRASGERLGTFVVITGGPGSSGISVADSYTDAYDPSIAEAYDIVFVDQRGIGLSEPIQCIDAAAAYYGSPAQVNDPATRDAAAEAARTFAADCVAEAGIDAADLPLYATTQAIHDLEAIREHLGAQQLDLYGESYGTQVVQQYAAAYPEHIRTLYVDGPVDLTRDGSTYYLEATRAAEDTLIATLEACTADERCRADVEGGDALAAFDALLDQLGDGPLQVPFVRADGSTEDRPFTRADLVNTAFYYLYSPADRQSLQRGIASASHGDLVPLLRMSYDTLAVDPETLEAIPDPSWSDALYYAVECQDYGFQPDAGDADARLQAWLAAGEAAGMDELRLGESFYGDLPCLYWPDARPPTTRPAPLTDPPFPVFVLASTTDPATPIGNGLRIFGKLDDATFIQTVGGPHVIFGWGEACPDELMTAWLVDGTRPSDVTTCDGSVAADYVEVAAPEATAYDDALDLMVTLDGHLLSTNDYLSRLEDELTLGCDFGGTLTYTLTDVGTDLALDACAFTPGQAWTGSGVSDDVEGTLSLDLTAGADRLSYARDPDGISTVEGTYGGQPVDLSNDGA